MGSVEKREVALMDDAASRDLDIAAALEAYTGYLVLMDLPNARAQSQLSRAFFPLYPLCRDLVLLKHVRATRTMRIIPSAVAF